LKAVLLYGKQDLRYVDVPKPKVGPTDVLVRVKACGICPTDLRKYQMGTEGSPYLPGFPFNMGHEWTGDVVEVGELVTFPEAGMRVRSAGWAGYAEYALINTYEFANRGTRIADDVVVLPDNVSYEEGSFVEGVSVGMHAVIDQAKAQLGDCLVIIGSGQMGLQQVSIAKLVGATVVSSDTLDWRLEYAKKFGADYVINPSRDDPAHVVKEITGGRMADAVIVTVGLPDAILQGLNVVGDRGRVVLFGGAPMGTKVSLDPNMIHYGEKTLIGCGYWSLYSNRAIGLISSHKVPVRELITHRFPLAKTEEAFRLALTDKQRYLKGMIIP
jgi:L-iditol 2-dehydrogenase